MNVQLILGAARNGIDDEAEILSRQGLAQPGIDEPGLVPRLGEVVGCRRREQCRALDARDPRRRDEQILRPSHDVLQDGKPFGKVDDRAGRGMSELRLVDHAAAMDDFPQDVGIGGSAEKTTGSKAPITATPAMMLRIQCSLVLISNRLCRPWLQLYRRRSPLSCYRSRSGSSPSRAGATERTPTR